MPIAWCTSAPRFRRSAAGEQEHLHHGPGRECLHDGAANRLDFRSRLAHFHPRDSFDLLPQRVGGAGEQLPVKLLHLSSAGRTLGHGLFGRRQGLVQRDHQGALAQDHGHRLGDVVARSSLLESDCRLGNLLAPWLIWTCSLGWSLQVATVPRHQTKKPTWLNTLRYSTTSAYSLTGSPAQAESPFI